MIRLALGVISMFAVATLAYGSNLSALDALIIFGVTAVVGGVIETGARHG